LTSGNVEIRVVPKERLFLHGKAGSIYYADGSRRSFIGSVNETKSAFANNYELVWQDDDEAVQTGLSRSSGHYGRMELLFRMQFWQKFTVLPIVVK